MDVSKFTGGEYMINIPTKTSGSLNSDNILSINHTRVQNALTRQDLATVNRGTCLSPDCRRSAGSTQQMPGPGSNNGSGSPAFRHGSTQQASGSNVRIGSGSPGTLHTSGTQQQTIHNAGYNTAQPAMSRTTVANTTSAGTTVRRKPPLRCLIQKGQKQSIGTAGQLKSIKIAMGWNTSNPQCDIDLSAYLLDSSGRVPGDDWFVFYSQTISPDGSVSLDVNGSLEDREIVTVDFTKLKPHIRKIVFVLTINEAFTRRLNFSMVSDAYIRLLDPETDREILSFLLTDYYANVTSMMLGEVYLYNDTWKFNAIGNGVARDLAGLCELYGVNTN